MSEGRYDKARIRELKMAVAYKDLVNFMKANAGDPVALGKIMTAWAWTSWYAFSFGVNPDVHNISNLDKTLYGACGFRSLLMQQLFSEIGLHTRQVSLFEVPVQGGHVATEIYVNGKWMYFDATFGIYFERRGGGEPLSLEEARANWSNVVVRQCVLEGWTGNRVDPASIDPRRAFANKTNPFFDHPGLSGTFDISGEINTLVRGHDVRYWENNKWTHLDDPASDRVVMLHDDQNRSTWRVQQTIYDTKMVRDYYYIEYDNGNAKYIDYDQDSRYEWSTISTYTKDIFYEYQITTVFDNKTVEVAKYDAGSQDWSYQRAVYTSAAKIDSHVMVFDDGREVVFDFDPMNYTAMTQKNWYYDSNGDLSSTLLVSDSGESRTIDWQQQNHLVGEGTLLGTDTSDLIVGSGKKDVLVGYGDADHLQGRGGDDVYYVDDPSDMVVEQVGSGVDVVNASASYELPDCVENLFLVSSAHRGTGNAGNNLIVGNEMGNRLDGLRGSDQLYGGAGADVLVGGDGRDWLQGDAGADTLYGGSGADAFIFRSAVDTGANSSAADLIADFVASSGDKIDVSAIDANVLLAGDQSFSFIGAAAFEAPAQIRYLQTGSEVRLLLNIDSDSQADLMIRVAGGHNVTSDWFIL